MFLVVSKPTSRDRYGKLATYAPMADVRTKTLTGKPNYVVKRQRANTDKPIYHISHVFNLYSYITN